MKYKTAYFHTSDHLQETFRLQLDEIEQVISTVQWAPDFSFDYSGRTYINQTGYNKAFQAAFGELGWEVEPVLERKPMLKGDFRKHLVFIEVQFGNSSTLFRDYYKFQYGLANGLLSLAVLIVPENPAHFFPTRIESIRNMADFRLAHKCFTMLQINVPTLVIGLMPEN